MTVATAFRGGVPAGRTIQYASGRSTTEAPKGRTSLPERRSASASRSRASATPSPSSAARSTRSEDTKRGPVRVSSSGGPCSERQSSSGHAGPDHATGAVARAIPATKVVRNAPTASRSSRGPAHRPSRVRHPPRARARVPSGSRSRSPGSTGRRRVARRPARVRSAHGPHRRRQAAAKASAPQKRASWPPSPRRCDDVRGRRAQRAPGRAGPPRHGGRVRGLAGSGRKAGARCSPRRSGHPAMPRARAGAG